MQDYYWWLDVFMYDQKCLDLPGVNLVGLGVVWLY